jgi:peptide/nickel transport system substrate-binding protein
MTLVCASDRVPPAGRNINYYRDAELTKLLYASDRTVDQAKRRDLLSQVQKRIADQAVEIPLYNTSKIDAVPATLKNFKGNPTNAGAFWNVYECEVSTSRP